MKVMRKENLGKKTKELWENPEYRKKMSDAHKGNPKNPGAYSFERGSKNKAKLPDVRKKISDSKLGEKNAMYNGGRSLNTSGYIFILVGNNTYKLEHRLVMERHIGRELSPEEVVHHINFNRSDNRIENLQLFGSLGEHTSHHHKLRKEGGVL